MSDNQTAICQHNYVFLYGDNNIWQENGVTYQEKTATYHCTKCGEKKVEQSE